MYLPNNVKYIKKELWIVQHVAQVTKGTIKDGNEEIEVLTASFYF